MIPDREIVDYGQPFTDLPPQIEGECDGCGYRTTINKYRRPQTEDPLYFCPLCAGTTCSNMAMYPNLYSGDVRDAMRAQCYIGNAMLDAINRQR